MPFRAHLAVKIGFRRPLFSGGYQSTGVQPDQRRNGRVAALMLILAGTQPIWQAPPRRCTCRLIQLHVGTRLRPSRPTSASSDSARPRRIQGHKAAIYRFGNAPARPQEGVEDRNTLRAENAVKPERPTQGDFSSHGIIFLHARGRASWRILFTPAC